LKATNGGDLLETYPVLLILFFPKCYPMQTVMGMVGKHDGINNDEQQLMPGFFLKEVPLLKLTVLIHS
jgi:hypothetical protein